MWRVQKTLQIVSPAEVCFGLALLEKFGRILLYLTDDAIAKLYVT